MLIGCGSVLGIRCRDQFGASGSSVPLSNRSSPAALQPIGPPTLDPSVLPGAQHGAYLLVLGVTGGGCTVDVTETPEASANLTLGHGFASLGLLPAGALATATVPLPALPIAGATHPPAVATAARQPTPRRVGQPGLKKLRFTFALVGVRVPPPGGDAEAEICGGMAGAFVFTVRRLRHHFRPFAAHFSAAPPHPTRAVCDALLSAHAGWVLIGAWDPML